MAEAVLLWAVHHRSGAAWHKLWSLCMDALLIRRGANEEQMERKGARGGGIGSRFIGRGGRQPAGEKRGEALDARSIRVRPHRVADGEHAANKRKGGNRGDGA